MVHYRYKSVRGLILFLLPLALTACEKDELTRPVEVNFQFKLDREAPDAGNLRFDAGSIEIQSITFTGDRETGEDITFISDFETNVIADLASGRTAPAVQFDVPQGTYSSIKLLIDPDDIAPDIIVTGQYMPLLIGPPVDVSLHIEIGGALNVTAKSPEGNTQIVLRKDSPATVEVFLNPAAWVHALPANLFESADVQLVGGIPSIVISKDANAEIYAKLAGLVEGSAEAIIR